MATSAVSPCGAKGEEKSVVQSSYESGIKELSQEFRIRLQDEITIRKGVERQLEKQNSLKKQMEMNIDHLKEDNGDKQATIASLKVSWKTSSVSILRCTQN